MLVRKSRIIVHVLLPLLLDFMASVSDFRAPSFLIHISPTESRWLRQVPASYLSELYEICRVVESAANDWWCCIV